MEQTRLDLDVSKLLPESDWSPPESLPDELIGAQIGFDLETKDLGLQTGKGPGWAWKGGGYVVGYSISADNFQGYLPIRHEGGGNMDITQTHRWLNHVLSNENQIKIGANPVYDVGWCKREGVTVKGTIYDVLWAEALLDEHKYQYNLDSVATEYLGEQKEEALLIEAARILGYKKVKENLWRLPAKYVGPYAEMDAELPIKIWDIQKQRLKEDRLTDIFELESALLYLYVDMRWRGVRIDVPFVEKLAKKYETRTEHLVEEIKRRTGIEINIWAAESIAPAFDKENIPYGLTPKSKLPSINKDLLENTDHWLCKAILQARESDKLKGTFLEGQLLGHLHDGRVHGQFHPLRGEDGGTVSGRGSMSDPNLQFIPQRTEEGRKIRRAFLPEEGCEWGKADYSQQEVRLLVHFAASVKRHGQPLKGVDRIIDFYRKDPDADFYELFQDLAGIARRTSKGLTLSKIYGQGLAATMEQLGTTEDETKELTEQFFKEAPFISDIMDMAQKQVKKSGQIRSLLGRLNRFPFWEPKSWDLREGKLLRYEAARKYWGNIPLVHARIHKALNSLIQPSAADQMKKAMLDVWNAGLGKYLLIQVHDELDHSVDDRAIGQQISDIMRDCVELKVPVKVGLSWGPNWGEVGK